MRSARDPSDASTAAVTAADASADASSPSVDVTPVADAADQPSGLTEREIAILAFERQWWRNPGAKEEAIRAEFDLSAARYYQVLGALVDSPFALAHDPMLIKRLQRMREARAEARARRSVISRPRTESN
jgi:hypothetical protein